MSGVRRQRPRWSELRPLLRMDPPSLRRTEQLLRRAHAIEDLRRVARRRVPRSVFDYVDGAADAEISLHRSREAFARVEFRARVLRDVDTVDPAVTVLGMPSALPIVLAPTGYTRMMHPEGERAVAAAAAAAGLVYTLSTVGTVSIEDLATVEPAGVRWFQLYPPRDRGLVPELVTRAQQAGYAALLVTADTAAAGQRLRDARNGLTVPPTLRLRTLGDMAVHPRWWLNVLTTEPLGFATLPRREGNLGSLLTTAFNPTMTVADLARLREQWSGPLLVKGVQHPDDAREFVAAGADGVVLSNHGGRQLDRAVPPLELLPEVRRVVGAEPAVLVDGGVLHGGDAVAAVGLGADAVLVGRAYLYGLMAGGPAGVTRAIEILDGQVRRTMQLLGVARLDQLSPDQVRLRTV